MLPLWLAMAASAVLHIGVLLAPGWGLPFDDEQEITLLDATLTVPAVVESQRAVPAPPPRKKRPPAKALPPPTPAAPQALMPAEPVAPAPESEPAGEPVDTPPSAEAEASPVVLPAPTFADRWPRKGRIVYRVTRGENGFIIGQSEQRWEHDGQRYSLHAEIETTGLAALFRRAKVTQDSRGVLDATGLRPLEFETRRDDRPSENVLFDTAQGRIVLGNGQSTPYVPAAQDLLSLFCQLGLVSLDVPHFPLTVATGRKVATYVIAVGEELVLETPNGPRPVRHLKVIGNAREDATEIWLDVETRLPLKIRHRDRQGETYDQIATSIEVEPLP